MWALASQSRAEVYRRKTKVPRAVVLRKFQRVCSSLFVECSLNFHYLIFLLQCFIFKGHRGYVCSPWKGGQVLDYGPAEVSLRPSLACLAGFQNASE